MCSTEMAAVRQGPYQSHWLQNGRDTHPGEAGPLQLRAAVWRRGSFKPRAADSSGQANQDTH